MIYAALSTLETDEQRDILTEFYKENKNKFYKIALTELRNKESAEDAIQEAFLNIVKYPEKFFEMDVHKRVPYALIILRNVISHLLFKTNQIYLEDLTEEVTDPIPSVEALTIGEMSAENLKKVIVGMPLAPKQAIQLKITYGLTNAQISDVLGVPEVNVRKNISNAYKIIYKFLNEEQK